MPKIYNALPRAVMSQGFEAKPEMVEFYKKLGMNNHGGYDFYANDGEKLYFDCSCSGYVLNTEVDASGGLGINIITEDKDGIFKHRYWHLKGFAVKAGDEVESGQLLGWCDNTGASTGSHLHRDMKLMGKNPTNGSLYVVYPNNGTYGTVRWDDYYTPIFILDQIKNLKGQVSILQKLIDLWTIIIKGNLFL
jgi:hypothetical protein